MLGFETLNVYSLACVTQKYTKSINCRRERSLADALNKSIVPLLLEETNTWPPHGPMSLVFTEKSFLDFRRSNEKVQPGNIWDNKEFEKILDRLKESIPQVNIEKSQQNISDAKLAATLIETEKPSTSNNSQQQKPARVKSVSILELQSRTCSII